MTPSNTPSANRFREWEPTQLVTESKHGKWKGGRHISGGYVRVKVKSHPKQDNRGYVLEHVMVMENNLRRYLRTGEYVHHKDGNRQNNTPSNLELMYSHKEHMDQHPRARNANKQFVAADPIFEAIKFRLHDVDAGVTKAYTLSKLINTTFRRGKFQFRGRWTGLTDQDGEEIFEGDIILCQWYDGDFHDPSYDFTSAVACLSGVLAVTNANGIGDGDHTEMAVGYLEGWQYKLKKLGNIYENPELLPSA